MIVTGHFIAQSGLQYFPRSLNGFLLVFFRMGPRIATNIFLIIGVWFMLDRKKTAGNILKLYGQVLFYSIPLTIIAVCFFREMVSFKSVIRSIFIFWGRGLWFVSAYITLMIMSPFLDIILKWDRKILKRALILAFVFISIVSTLPGIQDSYVCDSIWFWLVYLIIGYIKKYEIDFLDKNYNYLIFSMVIYVFLVLGWYLSEIYGLNAVNTLMNQFLLDIKTFPNFVISLLAFLYVKNLKTTNFTIINKISKCSFAVYIIHQMPCFISILWNKIFCIKKWINTPFFYYPIIVAFELFVFAWIMELFREKCVVPIIRKNKAIKSMERKLDKWLFEINGESNDKRTEGESQDASK